MHNSLPFPQTWQEPKQARSRARFNHILDVSGQLFTEWGYETTTTNHIAEQASVSIGALYRFFPNKEAILDALVARYIQNMGEVFIGEHDLSRPYEDVLADLIAVLMQFNEQESAFLHIWAFVDADVIQYIDQLLVGYVANLIGAYHPQLQGEALQLCATVGVAIVRGMMPLHNQIPQPTLEIEMKRALLAYLQNVLDTLQ